MKEELLEKQREILENMNIDENIRKRRIIEDNILKLKNMRIYDEVPFRIDKIMNQYYWKIIIKCNLNTYIAKAISYVVEKMGTDKDTLISVDLNPQNI